MFLHHRYGQRVADFHTAAAVVHVEQGSPLARKDVSCVHGPQLAEHHELTARADGARADALRGMLARLQPKEEVLLLGWGVPMPILVKSRRYDENFWKDLQGEKGKFDNGKVMSELGY